VVAEVPARTDDLAVDDALERLDVRLDHREVRGLKAGVVLGLRDHLLQPLVVDVALSRHLRLQ
jgi:hypothetical protein